MEHIIFTIYFPHDIPAVILKSKNICINLLCWKRDRHSVLPEHLPYSCYPTIQTIHGKDTTSATIAIPRCRNK